MIRRLTSIPSRFAERADEGESPVATAWKSSDFMNPKKGGTLPISFPPNNLPEIFHNWCNWCHELHLNVNMFLWKLELVCIVFQCLIRWTFAPSQEWQGCRGSLETFICHCYSKKGPRPIYIYIYWLSLIFKSNCYSRRYDFQWFPRYHDRSDPWQDNHRLSLRQVHWCMCTRKWS